jgi:hypothetical protein
VGSRHWAWGVDIGLRQSGLGFGGRDWAEKVRIGLGNLDRQFPGRGRWWRAWGTCLRCRVEGLVFGVPGLGCRVECSVLSV